MLLAMPHLHAVDGTEIAYRLLGEGAPVICLPGGPMRDSAYLGDLGGLGTSLTRCHLVLPDLRGTGRSAVPADTASYRCDRLIGDVEALADHLGLGSFDLLGHSAGASIAVQYAAIRPERISKLVLITPSGRAVGINRTSEARREVFSLRRHEPWFPDAVAALERIEAAGGDEDDWRAVAPFSYGRWDAEVQAYDAAQVDQINEEAAEIFGADGAFDPPATRAALAAFSRPVLLLAGELDAATGPRLAAEFAALFPSAKLVVQPGAGHFPWLDNAGWFASAVAEFLHEGR